MLIKFILWIFIGIINCIIILYDDKVNNTKETDFEEKSLVCLVSIMLSPLIFTALIYYMLQKINEKKGDKNE
jgi:hypothetical protein